MDHHKEGTETLEGAKKGISHLEFGIDTQAAEQVEKRLKANGFHA